MPLTMADVAVGIPCQPACSVPEFATRLADITEKLGVQLKTAEAETFIERALGALDFADMEPVRELSHKLCSLATQDWLQTGRQPLPMAAAAVATAVEILGWRSGKGDATVKRVSSVLAASEKTVRQRQGELRQTLLQRGKLLPWGDTLTPKNILAHARLILQHADKLTDISRSKVQTQSTDNATNAPQASALCELDHPPSFLELRREQDDKHAKILAAQTRLASLSDPSSAKNGGEERAWELDEQDHLLEQLLLKGVSVETLLEAEDWSVLARPAPNKRLSDEDVDSDVDKYICSPSEVALRRTLLVDLTTTHPTKRSRQT